jgi:ribosomal protein L19
MLGLIKATQVWPKKEKYVFRLISLKVTVGVLIPFCVRKISFFKIENLNILREHSIKMENLNILREHSIKMENLNILREHSLDASGSPKKKIKRDKTNI